MSVYQRDQRISNFHLESIQYAGFVAIQNQIQASLRAAEIHIKHIPAVRCPYEEHIHCRFSLATLVETLRQERTQVSTSS
jgi:hypothetical protein